MRLVILHHHIFKNAGSTIEEILDHSFGDGFGALETADHSGLISSQELVRYLESRSSVRAFSSHQIRYPLPEAPGFVFFDICFLRDPLDRLRSFYDYFRQRPNPADPMSDLANRSTLGDFAAGMIRDHSLFIRNNQVNLLACAGDSDEPEEGDLDLAIRRIMAASFLGVVDCFDRSVLAGEAALRPVFPELDCARPAVNVSRGMQGSVGGRVAELRQACTTDVYNELLSITALDRRLVDLARDEVLRRFEAIKSVRAEISRCTAESAPGSVVADEPAWFTSLWRLLNLLLYLPQFAGNSRKIVFDRNYYPDSWFSFVLEGAWQGRSPHPLFDPAFYLQQYPDVAASGVNPLCHYLKHGYRELRVPHPLFDPVFYLERNPDVARAGLNPLLHYLRNGAAEDRKPHPLFEPKYYRASCGVALRPDQNPLIHFLESGAQAASPHPLFNCEAWRNARPELVERGLNPLVHFLSFAHDVRDEYDSPTLREVFEHASVVGMEIVEVEIQDVSIVVFCLDREPSLSANAESFMKAARIRAASLGLRGNTAIVWQDLQGRTRWIAEPQQEPFLRAIMRDQIRAQLKTSR